MLGHPIYHDHTMILKTIIFLFIFESIQSAKLPRRFEDPIGIQVYNPKDGSNRLLQGKIVRIYDSLSEAQRDFRSLMKRGHKIHGQRLFGLEKLLPFAQQALPLAQQAIGLFQSLQGGGGGGPPPGPPPGGPPPGPPPGGPPPGAAGPPPGGPPPGAGGGPPPGPPPGAGGGGGGLAAVSGVLNLAQQALPLIGSLGRRK